MSAIKKLGEIPFALAMLLAASSPSNAASVSNGLRFSAALDQLSPHKNLRVQLKNVSSAALDVYVGAEEASTEYNFQFTATSPHGKQHLLFDLDQKAFEGLMIPIVIRLSPGASRTFVFHLHDIGYYCKTRAVRLGTLLQQDYTARVSLEVQEEDLRTAEMGGLHSPVCLWTGRVISGEIGL